MKKAILPQSGAVYRKTGFHSALYDEWIQAIGDKMFTYFFDKGIVGLDI
ncbi:hypothetical protein KHA80_21030 [Anaerobacillus sp. HL2]|nr:hypothetical protein KHA80_21030 [Anaerobacillus sp. HL2]